MFGRGCRTLRHLEEGAATVLNCRTLRNALVRLLHEMRELLCLATTLIVLCTGALKAAEAEDVRMGFLSYRPLPPPSYELNPVPEDEGLAGGRLAIRDNNTTGAFTGQRYSLDEVWLEENEDPVAKARALAQEGVRFLIVNLPSSELLAVADALKGQSVVLFNVGATDDRLRGADCRANVLHTAPSRAMLTR